MRFIALIFAFLLFGINGYSQKYSDSNYVKPNYQIIKFYPLNLFSINKQRASISFEHTPFSIQKGRSIFPTVQYNAGMVTGNFTSEQMDYRGFYGGGDLRFYFNGLFALKDYYPSFLYAGIGIEYMRLNHLEKAIYCLGCQDNLSNQLRREVEEDFVSIAYSQYLSAGGQVQLNKRVYLDLNFAIGWSLVNMEIVTPLEGYEFVNLYRHDSVNQWGWEDNNDAGPFNDYKVGKNTMPYGRIFFSLGYRL